MGKIKIIKEGYRCGRCGHEWIMRMKNKPCVCPKCKSPYWDTPRKYKNTITMGKMTHNKVGLKRIMDSKKLLSYGKDMP